MKEKIKEKMKVLKAVRNDPELSYYEGIIREDERKQYENKIKELIEEFEKEHEISDLDDTWSIEICERDWAKLKEALLQAKVHNFTVKDD